MIEDSIFIPIAACEERHIELTIKSALTNAKNPEKIFFGVFNNIINKDHSLLNNKFITQNNQIFYVEVISPSPMGVGFGRMNASLLQFNEFEYSFQIDAHTLFTKNWDEKIIYYFNKIKNENNIDKDKLILSANAYLTWIYDDDNIYILKHNRFYDESLNIKVDPINLENFVQDEIDKGLVSNKIVYDGLQGTRMMADNVGFPIVYGDHLLLDLEYKEIKSVHGTFMFSTIKLNREVLHDGNDIFHGDQTNYSIRLIDRGYRIFTPKYPSIAVLNKQPTQEFLDPSHNWKSVTYGTNGVKYYNFKRENSAKFFNDIISGEYFGYWGATNQVSLNNIRKDIGYDTKKTDHI